MFIASKELQPNVGSKHVNTAVWEDQEESCINEAEVMYLHHGGGGQVSEGRQKIKNLQQSRCRCTQKRK